MAGEPEVLLLVRAVLPRQDHEAVLETFRVIELDMADSIRSNFVTKIEGGVRSSGTTHPHSKASRGAIFLAAELGPKAGARHRSVPNGTFET